MNKNPYPNREGFANVISEVVKSAPKVAGIKYENAVDISILEKPDQRGSGLYANPRWS